MSSTPDSNKHISFYLSIHSVVIKTEAEGDSILYEREAEGHEFDCIRNSPFIRRLYEAVDNGTDKCMVLEWMDQDLWSLRHQKLPLDSPFPKIVARSILSALATFSDMDGQIPTVHTGKKKREEEEGKKGGLNHVAICCPVLLTQAALRLASKQRPDLGF